MNAEQLVREGKLAEALAALQEEIRQNPGDSKRRLFLFQLNCILGQWDKALSQLQVVASLDADTMLLAQVFRPVIACELLRREVFAGTRTPLIFGEPDPWISLLVQAVALVAQEQDQAAGALRIQAFEAAPSSAGSVNGNPFEWIADADSRLGPVIEVILEGKYYWIPFHRIARIEMEPPNDLRDLVWMPARFTWTNGGMASAHIPVRYPDTENSGEDSLRLARKTTWLERPAECFLGLGQRLLTTDAGEHPLLECRTVEMARQP